MITSIEPKFGSWNADILKAAFHTEEAPWSVQPGDTTPPGWILLVGPHQLNAAMLTAIARLGERHAIRVLDGGNRFNAYTVARLMRGRPEVLEHITVSRAFTCYQVLALLEGTLATGSVCVVLDLLNTFYDESVQAGERKRLLWTCLTQLERLGHSSKSVVSVHPPKVSSRVAVEMLAMLQSNALDTIFIQPEPAAPEPLRLF